MGEDKELLDQQIHANYLDKQTNKHFWFELDLL